MYIIWKKNNIDSIPPLLYDDKMISDDYIKANILNEYFTSVSNIADDDRKVNIYNQPHPHNLENMNITSKDVHDIIKSDWKWTNHLEWMGSVIEF